ncbi:MAG: LLM class flavin-dependent oxidoreductase [Chloroflexi bacterium]|nr:LLM class flavin-dependent oxidoreductase [Chloroflexota bacterium]
MAAELKFGWISPVIGPPESDHVPIVQYQIEQILPTAFEHFDSVWMADHFYGFDRKSDPFLEAWTTMTWVAAKFPEVLLCHHVLGHGYRNPALIAKMAATLQTLSGGRFILGIGAGWREEEYDAYGYEFPSTATRLRQLEEVVQICRLMWTEESPSFEGKHFQIRDAMAPPLPDPPPPICIGSQGEQIGLPLVGRQADMWNTVMTPNEEDWIRKRDIVLSSAQAAGRDPGSIEISATREAPLPTSDEEVAEWLSTLRRWADLGISHFVLDFGHVTSTDLVERFAEQVIQPLKDG